MKAFRKNWKLTTLLLIALFDTVIFYAIAREAPTNYVTIAFLDVGQGDAIYIESPTHNQLMIDGGPSSVVLSELGNVLPFYDRSIDALLVTNPDADHYAGFIHVLNSFDVGTVIEPATKSDTETYVTFERDVDAEHAQELLAKKGMIIHLGGGADLYILFPDRETPFDESNEGSVIAKLVYGNNSVMLTGDAPSATEEYVLNQFGSNIDSDILKVGHHGSRTSASETFVQEVSPQYAVISAAKNSRYGHPHKETIDLFKKLNIPVLGTYNEGTIIFKLDGTTISRQ